MSSRSLAAARMARAVGHESNSNRVSTATPFEADYMTDANNTGWVGETLAELRSDAFADGHRLNARTKVTVELVEGTYMNGVEDGVIGHHLFLHSDPGQSPEATRWHTTESLTITEDYSGTCRFTLNGSRKLSWDFSKEEDFFYTPDELLQVVEVAEICMFEAYGRSTFGGSVLPTRKIIKFIPFFS